MSAKFKTKNLKPKTAANWRKEIERVLITEEQLARRVKALAREIERDFRGRENRRRFALERNGHVSRGFDPSFEPAAPP